MIQMTRAEYEAKYGAKPSFSDSQTPTKTKDRRGFLQEGGAVQQFGTGLAKGALQTTQGLGQLAIKGANALTGGKIPALSENVNSGFFPNDPNALKAEGTAEKLGKFTEQVAEFAVPGSKLAKATQAMKFIPKIGARALTSGGVASAQHGEIGKEAAIAAGTEIALPVVGKVIKPAVKFLGNLLKGTSSGLSGAPSEAIEQIYKNPKVALQTAKEIRQGGSSGVLRKNAEKVVQGISKIKKEARTKYGEGIAILKAEDIKPSVFRKGIQGLFDKYGFSTSKQGREIANVEFRDVKNLKKANSIANMLTNTELNGLSLNKTLKRIEDLKYPSPKTEEGMAFNAFVDDISENVKQILNKSTDKLGEINKAYSTDMQLAEATEKILGKVKYKNLEEINRAAKNLEGIFTDTGLDPTTVDSFLERIGVSSGAFKASEAMRQVSEKSFSPNSVGTSPFEVIRAFTSAVVSPKMVGQIAAYTGLAENAIKEMSQKLSPATRGAIIKLLTGNPTQEPNGQ